MVIRFQAAVQIKLREHAQEIMMNLEQLLVETYGNEASSHFPWSKNKIKTLLRVYKSIPTKNIENEDLALEDLMMKEEDKDDELANTYLEGLDILKDYPKETVHKEKMRVPESLSRGAMIIQCKSNDSINRISLDSRITIGSVYLEQNTSGKERPTETVQQKEKEKTYTHV